jgi:HEAT repeat protein
MRRMMIWSLAVVAVGLMASAALAAEEPIEEWQVRGTLAALKDGYPQVRALAASELEDLLKPDAPDAPRREWKGQSASLLNEARGDLRELLKDADADVRIGAARALARLYERAKDVTALRELLHDPEAGPGFHAAESLARLYEANRDVSGLRDLLRDVNPNAAWSAALALARLYAEAKDAPALGGLLADSDRNVRWYAAQALARLHEETKNVSALREMLKDSSLDVRRPAAEELARLGEKAAEPVLRDILRDKDTPPDTRWEIADALVRLGEKDALSILRDFLKDSRPNIRERVAEALVGVQERGKDAAGLRDLLKDASPEVREQAARALARMYAGAKDAAALREMIQIQDADAYREGSWALIRLYQAEGDKSALREFLKTQDAAVYREAAWALGRLGEKDVIPSLREMLREPFPDARRETTRVLTQLGDTDPLAVLHFPYEDISSLYWARWLAHYWGGKKPEVARVLCAYLGRPKDDPTIPVSDGRTRREGALADLRILREEAWEKTDSPWIKEDVAQWWSWLITQEGIDWKSADEVAELKRIRDVLGKEMPGRRYNAGIDRVLEPYEISPPPFVRTIIVFALLNFVAVLLAFIVRRLGSRGRWFPVGAYFAGLLVACFADVGGWEHRAYTIPWLLAVVSLAWFGLLIVVAAITWGPHTGKMRDHTAAIGARLRDDRDRAGYEEYVALPADVRSESHPGPMACADPAAVILARLMGADGPKGSVLVEAPAGTGKSALVREVMSRALDRFKEDPPNGRVPVLLGGESESFEKMIEAGVASVLPSVESLSTLLDMGRIFLILDGVSESGPVAEVLAAFVNDPHGRNTPMLVAARPGGGYARAVQGARWMTVEPKALDAESLGKFTAGYGGPTLLDPVLSACRGPDGGYLPRLVRMAMIVNPHTAGPVSAADLYREFFLKALEGQFPAEVERIKRLDEASRWCLETYWRDGLRRRKYVPTDTLQQQLRQAGLLVVADANPEPKEVLFADVTMQSYLTAHGLATQDRQGYKQLPRPTDNPDTIPWDRGRVLLRAAADAELFRLCLANFTPKKEFRGWLKEELARWAAQYDEDLPRRKVLSAIPAPLAERLREVRGSGKVLAEAACAGFNADESNDSVEVLGNLYARVAPLVGDLEGGGSFTPRS